MEIVYQQRTQIILSKFKLARDAKNSDRRWRTQTETRRRETLCNFPSRLSFHIFLFHRGHWIPIGTWLRATGANIVPPVRLWEYRKRRWSVDRKIDPRWLFGFSRWNLHRLLSKFWPSSSTSSSFLCNSRLLENDNRLSRRRWIANTIHVLKTISYNSPLVVMI